MKGQDNEKVNIDNAKTMIKLTYRELDDYKYQVLISFLIRTDITGIDIDTAIMEYLGLDSSGLLYIKSGYAWNGSNWSSDKHAMIASLVHDALYQLMRLGLLNRTVFRKPADALYRDLCIAEGMSKFEAAIRYRGLRWFGKSSTYIKKKTRGLVKMIIIKYKKP